MRKTIYDQMKTKQNESKKMRDQGTNTDDDLKDKPSESGDIYHDMTNTISPVCPTEANDKQIEQSGAGLVYKSSRKRKTLSPPGIRNFPKRRGTWIKF